MIGVKRPDVRRAKRPEVRNQDARHKCMALAVRATPSCERLQRDLKRVTVPVKVSRPSDASVGSSTTFIFPLPRNPVNEPVPLTIVLEPFPIGPCGPTSGVKPTLTVPSGQVIVRSIRPYGSTAGSVLPWESTIVPPAQNGERPSVDPSSTSPVAIGSAPTSAAMTILVRITIGSPRGAVVEATLVFQASSSSPLHAPRKSTPTRTSTNARRMTAPTISDEHDPRRTVLERGRLQSSCDELD